MPKALPIALLAWLAAAAAGLPRAALAHEIPSDATVQIIVKPDGQRLRLLVRAPLEAMQDIELPTFGKGYVDVERADRALRNAALLWLANDIDLYENGRQMPAPELVAARLSIPSDRSFASYATALAHVHGPPLPAGTELPWQQALLDIELEAPIASPDSLFSIEPRLSRLAMRVVNAVRFVRPDGAERVFSLAGDGGLVDLDPRRHRAALRFVAQGFAHILDGTDHLLFLLCLVVPFRREPGALVWLVTAFTAGHSVTLIASALGAAPSALWFPPLVETLIAASILCMAIDNAVAAGPACARRLRVRFGLAFGFGLIHGFGFAFALTQSLQFAGDHVATSLAAFNIGIELGQLLVLLLLIPALYLAFRYVVAERAGVIVLSVIVGHTAWHWMAERYATLAAYDLPWR